MMRGRYGRWLVSAFLLIAGPAAAGETKDFPCSVPEDLLADHSALVHSATAIRMHGRLTILAIGSLSTAGAGTSPATSWPARLAVELRQRFPAVTVNVINRGRARQMAADMLAKLDADVTEVQPDMVIWESGTLDAINNTDPDTYSETLLTGTDRLMAEGIDVVLMDPQYSRASTAVIDFEPYVQAVHHVATMRDLLDFPRFRIMHYWVSEGLVTFSGHPRAEQVHTADHIYACIAGNLAQMIANGIATADGAAAPANGPAEPPAPR